MEYAILRLKSNRVMMDMDLVETEVKAGTRILVELNTNEGRCISFKELSLEELIEQVDYNECFEKIDTVTTRKGSKVHIFRDMESLDTYFYKQLGEE